MIRFSYPKAYLHSSTLESTLAQLWEVCKDTPQAPAVQILFQLLVGHCPEGTTEKAPGLASRSIFYRLFQGIRVDNKTELFFQKKCYLEAARLDEQLLLSGYLSPRLLLRYAKRAFRHFQFCQAFYFCELLRTRFPRWHPGKILLLQGQCAQLCDRPIEALALYTQAILHYGMPATINAPGYDDALQKQLHGYPWKTLLALAQAKNPHIYPLRRGQAFLLGSAYKEAEEYLQGLPCWYYFRPRYQFLLARSYIARKKKEEAEKLLIRLIRWRKSYTPAYNEALRLACLSGDADLGIKILKLAQENAIALSPSFEWIMLCHKKQLKEAFIRHSQASHFNILLPYLGKKLLYSLPQKADSIKTLLVLSECFPGDEIKFSRLYPLIHQKAYAEKIIFSCSPSAYDLLQRSFPGLHFLVTRRAQSVALLDNYDNFADLPDSECCRYVDNKGWAAIQKADGVISVMHALADVLESYTQLAALPHLIPSPEKKALLDSRLKNFRSQKLVGLSWRSMQNSLSREWANFHLEELAPLLELEGIQFISCQYDGCTAQEHHWLETYFPGKLLILADINQQNDIDTTAALYACLDIIVTVPTYTCELSGSVGTPTLIFAASHIPEAFTAPGSSYHAFLGTNTRCVCTFTNKSDVIQRVKKTLQAMLP